MLILDGGMGNELLRRSEQSGGLWSAQALVDAPDLVTAVHQDYIDAGADVIITNTYATVPSYLAKSGLADRYLALADLAGRLARDVADRAGRKVLVAGSLPPLDESFRPDLAPADDQAREIYEALTGVLLPYVDLYLCETMSSVRESVNALTAARAVVGADKPVWVSWTLSESPGGGLRSGETVGDAVAATAPLGVDAYLYNCSTPESISVALPELVAAVDVPVGVYPNLLHIPEGWTLDNDVATGRRELSVDDFVSFTARWRALGASMIGGCCGIGPDYISALYRDEMAGSS